MNIKLACVGKLKDRFYIEAAAEYAKRLGRYAAVEICEVADEKTPETLSDAEAIKAVAREGKRLLAGIADGEYVIALAIDGKKYDSVRFSKHVMDLFDAGKAKLTFVIGGSLGLDESVLRRANERLSLSDMTFPHRLARVLLLEQLYRAFKIHTGEPYHK